MRHQAALVADNGDSLGTGTIDGQKVLKVIVMNVDASQLITVVGTRSIPNLITSSGYSVSAQNDIMMFVKGSGGPVTVSANPQIGDGQFVGQRMDIIGTDDTDTVTFTDGNGLELNGNYTMVNKSRLSLQWDGTVWGERGRNDI